MSLILSAALALALQAAPAPAAAPRQVSPATAEDFAQAREVLAAQLPDFRETWFRNTRGNIIMFCGEMNTLTNLGVYTGWVRFGILHYDATPRLYIEGRDDRFLALCDPTVTRAAPTEPFPDYSREMIYR